MRLMMIVLLGMAEAVLAQVPDNERARIAPLTGDYVGVWNTATISRYELDTSVMRLALSDAGDLTLTFYLDADAAARGEPLDLLGFGCQSRVGAVRSLKLVEPDALDRTHTVLEASFEFDWGRCPTRVYSFAENPLELALAIDPVEGEQLVRLSLLQRLQPDNQTYIERDGERRRVEIRKTDGGTLYHPAHEYCVVNEVGETETCFARESELKRYFVPFPLPGASAVWWTRRDKVDVVKGQRATYHEALYRRPIPDSAP